jgi:uncharacterized YccA/Bax inhibitor family protein
MKSSNPVLSDNIYDVEARHVGYGRGMTVSGTINKAGVLMLLVMLSAAWTWMQFFAAQRDVEFGGTVNSGAITGYLMLGAFGGFIVAMVTTFKKEWSPITAPIYALLEGLFLGGISAIFELRFPGIAIQAVAATFGTCFCLLLAYRSGLIRVSEKFTLGVVAATGGIALVYFLNMILSFFHVQIPGIFGSGPVGILFSLVVVVVASLNLILDFSLIEQGAQKGAPKYMEWYSAFALMVTLVWLYLEMLRLLSKLRGDNRR